MGAGREGIINFIVSKVEFGVDERSSESLAREIKTCVADTADRFISYVIYGCVGALTTPKIATIDVCRRLSVGVRGSRSICSDTAGFSDFVSQADDFIIMLAAYMEEIMPSADWHRLAKVLVELPDGQERTPSRLVNILVNFPEHGSVIIQGANRSSSIFKSNGKMYEAYVNIVKDIAAVVASWDSASMGALEDLINRLVGWFDVVTPAFLGSFLWSEERETQLRASYVKIMKELCFEGLGFFVFLNMRFLNIV